MICNGANSACLLDKSRCASINHPNSYDYLPADDIQQSNIELSKQSIAAGEKIVNHYPLHFDLVLGGYCNLKCHHCYQRGNNIEPLNIVNFINEISTFMRHASIVYLLGGEPTVCPDYNVVIDVARRIGGKRLSLCTNGHFIIQKIIPNIDLFQTISVSLDACSAESYKKTRFSYDAHYDWDRLMHNLKYLKRHRDNISTLEFMYVITKHNYHEMSKMVEMASDFKASIRFMEPLQISYAHLNEYNRQSILWTIGNEQISDSLDMALENAAEKNVRIEYQFASISRCGSVN
jgi:MoaA/NifB/PqqE/SkfB family radical SAM enzyme